MAGAIGGNTAACVAVADIRAAIVETADVHRSIIGRKRRSRAQRKDYHMSDNAAFWAKLHGKDASLAAYFRERGYELPCYVPDDVYMRLYQEWEALQQEELEWD